MQEESAGIIRVLRERKEEATEVLARAMENDPGAKYVFLGDTPGYRDRIRQNSSFYGEVMLEREFPILARVHQDQIVGVAFVLEPIEKPIPTSLAESWQALKASFGPEASHRFDTFMELVEELRPAVPHMYLSTIGVEPDFQGQGHGRALIEAVHAMSESDPTSTGVGLDTDNPANVPLYEHLGYEVVKKAKLGELDVWAMFRPNGA
jgi:ribosomal protein S18 acetylase RimI-like enzyme